LEEVKEFTNFTFLNNLVLYQFKLSNYNCYLICLMKKIFIMYK
jgi:hypothetical protein